jgi:hypothetical protein
MSFQWQFVAAVLYVELGITLLLCLRPISSKWWSSLFKSSIAKKVASNGSTVFYILASILGLFCVDAWREMQKYVEREEQAKNEATVNPDTLNHILMWKFRSQRNLYIRSESGCRVRIGEIGIFGSGNFQIGRNYEIGKSAKSGNRQTGESENRGKEKSRNRHNREIGIIE